MRIYVGTTERNLETIKTHVTDRANEFRIQAGAERDDFILEETKIHAAYIELLDGFESIANKLEAYPIGTLTAHVRSNVYEGGQFILQPTDMEGYDFSLGVFAPLLKPIAQTDEVYDYSFDDITALSLEELKNYTAAINNFLLNFSVIEQFNKNILIDGNSITPADLDNLKDIRKHLSEVESLFGFLSDGAKQALLDMHSEDTWLGHIARWGAKNAGEAIEAIRDAHAISSK